MTRLQPDNGTYFGNSNNQLDSSQAVLVGIKAPLTSVTKWLRDL